jgi:hypothetical protein
MPGTRPGMTKKRAEGKSLSSNRIVQVVPSRIVSQDQSHLPLAKPMLDVVFALDGRLNCFVKLEIDKAFDGVSLRKARDQSIPVFVDSPDKIACHPNVQDAVGCTGHDVNVAAGHPRMMKDVDGRDKPGHDDFS